MNVQEMQKKLENELSEARVVTEKEKNEMSTTK